MKIRFIEPGNLPYKKSISNYFIYNQFARTPSNGIIGLATILKNHYADVYCYSESISKILWSDILDSDIIFISIFSFNADRGYELANFIRQKSNALIVFGGLHATLNYTETIKYCDYVLLGEGDETITLFVNAINENSEINFAGVVYKKDNKIINTGIPVPPRNIDTVPDRELLYNFKKMTGHSTIWPQVHASRGCPHNCDYCTLVTAFGHAVRTRSVESVIEDIKLAIDFFDNGHKRLAKMLWITDDNFFANRDWAISILNAIIENNIHYQFTIQARYEVGFDDEMLSLLKKAGFVELAMGIEFLDDVSFKEHHKKSTYEEVLRAVQNIQAHGLRVRGLFIFGTDNQEKGIGEELVRFVDKYKICGVLIQSMYFIPGTPVFDKNYNRLLEHNKWDRCVGKVVHYPKNMSPIDLQKEIIIASKKVYSFPKFIRALFCKRGLERTLFLGECLWQYSERRELKRDLKYIKKITDHNAHTVG